MKSRLKRASEAFGPNVFFKTRFCDGSGEVMLCKVIDPEKPTPPWSTQELGHGDTKDAALQDAADRFSREQRTPKPTRIGPSTPEAKAAMAESERAVLRFIEVNQPVKAPDIRGHLRLTKITMERRLQALQKRGIAHVIGRGVHARWHAGAGPPRDRVPRKPGRRAPRGDRVFARYVQEYPGSSASAIAAGLNANITRTRNKLTTLRDAGRVHSVRYGQTSVWFHGPKRAPDQGDRNLESVWDGRSSLRGFRTGH